MLKKIILFTTLILTCSLPSFGQNRISPPMSHSVSLRFGANFDRSKAMVNDHPLTRNAASFDFLVNYDFMPLPFLSIGPEFAYFLPRSVSENTFDDNYSLRWHELQAGMMMKFTLSGLLYMGYGLGVGYAFHPTSTPTLEQEILSSVYPYLSVELGGNIIVRQGDEASPFIGINLALRGSTNIALWKDPLPNNRVQNQFNVGLILGVSLMWLDVSWMR